MKKIYFVLLGSIISLSSCQKSISDFDPSQQPVTGINQTSNTINGGLTATIDGKLLHFTVVSAILKRFPLTNEKRMDIAAISTDNRKKIIITLGEKTAQGNEMTKKKYILNAFPADDPTTPNIDESAHSQGYTTYGTLNGTGLTFDIYDEVGSFTVGSCDASTRLISGTFETTLTIQSGIRQITKITSGNIMNVKYRVIR